MTDLQEISARFCDFCESRVHILQTTSFHKLAPNGRPSGPRRRRSIRRWALLVASLALTSAFAIVSWGSAQAQDTCGGVMESDKPELFGDCDILLSLKATLAGSDTLNWSEDTPISNWDGGITVGGSPQRVTALVRSSKGLTGAIPSALGDLGSLETLNLSGNQLTGTIPSDLGRLSNLGTLNLSKNQSHSLHSFRPGQSEQPGEFEPLW